MDQMIESDRVWAIPLFRLAPTSQQARQALRKFPLNSPQAIHPAPSAPVRLQAIAQTPDGGDKSAIGRSVE